MLPTPSTSHVDFNRVYEPAEDSYLLLDTLSSWQETQFLHRRFPSSSSDASVPLITEIGPGSGVVLAFVAANVEKIIGRHDVLTLGIDINRFACEATTKTITSALSESTSTPKATLLDILNGDLVACVRPQSIDMLIFNPPYVPTEELPDQSKHADYNSPVEIRTDAFDRDSHLLALSYAGGVAGMEVTNRLLQHIPEVLSSRGVAYILLCAQNKPEQVKLGIQAWGSAWLVETVGTSGKQGGWEKLQIIRIWRHADV